MINQKDFKSILQFTFNENMGGLIVGLTEVSFENEKYLEMIEMTLHKYISNREWDISFNGRGKLYIGDQEEGFIEVELRNKVFPHPEFGDSDTNELFRFEVKRLLVECFHNLIKENSDDSELTDDFIENFELPFNLQLKTIDGIVLPKDVKLDCLKNDVHIASEQSIQIAERIYRAVKSDITGAVFMTLGGDNTEIEFLGLSGEVEVFEYSVSPITIEIR